MKQLRKRFEHFCYRNRNKGIPNLMLFVSLGAALVYFLTMFTENTILYSVLCFDRELILQGQIWRLITYPLAYSGGSVFLTAITLFCYYSLGKAMENAWGTLKFNLFYFTGILMMDVYCMIFGGYADAYYLNLSLFLGYATLYPNAHFLLFFIIPVKAWIFALFDLALAVLGLLSNPFPANLFSVISLANYFLFFGKDVINVIPVSWQANFRRLFRKKQKGAKVIAFSGSYEAAHAKPVAPHTHRCSICGRTDVTDPDLEFRYCSRCNGYHCYCIDHINNHTHVE